MKDLSNSIFLVVIAVVATFGFATRADSQTRTIRIANYNIEDDINGATTPLPGLIAPTTNTAAVQYGGVVEGIGEEIIGNDPAQPVDILALEETTSNPITVAPIVAAMNTFYNATNMYAMSPYQATESGGDVADGNGPNAVVYNTRTLQLLASVGVGTPEGSTNGEYRQVVRYEFAPAGQTPTATNEFYIYVSHYKSGTTSSDMTYRNEEAVIVRNDEANNLPATARVIYVGDYNVDTSGEAMYQTLLATNAPNGVHQGRGIDPLNVTNNPNINWGVSTTNTNILAMMTEHGYNLEYRDDLQVMTSNVYYGTPGGLAYVQGTFHAFANNGTTPYGGSVNSSSNTALINRLASNAPTFISAAQLYLDLTDASDHLPVVGDYTIPLVLPVPTISAVKKSAANLLVTVANASNSFTYTLLQSTNIHSARTNWTPVATNYLTASGNFVFTVTNPPSNQAFYTVSVH